MDHSTFIVIALLGLGVLIHLLKWESKRMSEAVDRLAAEVAELTTVTKSAEALLSTLAQEIRDNAGDEAALNALADKIDANTNELAAAVEANTQAPAEAEQPVEEPTGEGDGAQVEG